MSSRNRPSPTSRERKAAKRSDMQRAQRGRIPLVSVTLGRVIYEGSVMRTSLPLRWWLITQEDMRREKHGRPFLKRMRS